MKPEYDKKDPRSIESFGKRLVGKTLKEVQGVAPIPVEILSTKPGVRSKASFGSLIESYYYGINPDNHSGEADFSEAGVELKTTPVKKLNNGKYSAKERLVLGLINYIEESKKDFETSSFFKKNKRLMLVSYLYDKSADVGDLLIKAARLIEFDSLPVEDQKIIREDWEKINTKIREGKAHELSEGDTLYLGACTKAADSSVFRDQPGGHQAKPRAYSFKSGYMTELFRRELGAQAVDEEKAIKDFELKEPVPFEDAVVNKFELFIGKTVEQIHSLVGQGLNRDSKGYYAALARRMLGVKAARVAEFDAAEVSMKTIRLGESGTPEESMSFPAFKYSEIINEEWDADEDKGEMASSFQRQIEKRFFFVIFQRTGSASEGELRLKRVMFWSMPFEDRQEAKHVWMTTRELIKLKKLDYLPGSTDNRVAHVRPHGRDSNDTEMVDGKGYVKKSFWLNQSYLKNLLN